MNNQNRRFNVASLRMTALGLTLVVGLGARTPDPSSAPGPKTTSLTAGPQMDSAYYGENSGLQAAESLKRPVADAQGRQVKDWTFTVGQASYTLSGKATYFRTGGVIRGFYFAGDGRVDYVSKDAVELPVIRKLLQLHTNVHPTVEGGAVHVKDEVNEGLFWFAGMAVPELPGTPCASDPAKILARSAVFLERDQAPFQHELAKRLLGSTDKPYARVQFQGRRQFWLHTVDALDAESLRVNQGIARDHFFYRPTLLVSQQPIAWTHKSPKRPLFALTAMDLDVKAENEFAGRVQAVQTFTPLVDGLQALDLVLPNRFVAGKLQGPATVRMRVDSVTDAEGHPLAFDHANGGLLVAVPGLKRQVPVTLRIQMEGEMFSTMGSGRDSAWIPMPKEQAAKIFTLKFHGQAPKPWLFLGAGDNTRIWTEGDVNHVEAKFEKPVESFKAVIMRYALQQRVETVEFRGLTLTRLRSPEYLRQESYEQKFDPLVGHEIETLEQMMGATPFQHMFEIWDMMQPNRLLDTLPDTLRFEGFGPAGAKPGVYTGSVFSLAAQYWGQVAKPWSSEDAWLTEALPLYCGVLAQKNWILNGQKQFEQSMAEWYRKAERAKDAGSMATASRLQMEGGFMTSSTYFRSKDLTTSKGVCLLYTLHQELGDERFAAFLKTCLSTASYRPFSTASMPGILKRLTGKDYEPFFDRYFWGSDVLKQPALPKG